jgi:hypothetical protein
MNKTKQMGADICDICCASLAPESWKPASSSSTHIEFCDSCWGPVVVKTVHSPVPIWLLDAAIYYWSHE